MCGGGEGGRKWGRGEDGGSKVVPIGKRGLSRRHCTADNASSLEGTCIQTGQQPSQPAGRARLHTGGSLHLAQRSMASIVPTAVKTRYVCANRVLIQC